MQQEKDSRDMSVISRESNQLPADIDDFHNGLRILARMIARAYIKELDLKHQQLKEKQANAKSTSSKANLIRKFPKRRLALTVPETAVLLGVDRASVYDGVISGQIPSIRIGQEIVIPKAALVKLLSISLKDDKKNLNPYPNELAPQTLVESR
jgi:excisionase family DNA binding protein